MQEDNKEHSFEVSLFAEMFNEMLMRDFAFRIFRSIYDAPEKPKDEVNIFFCMNNLKFYYYYTKLNFYQM